MLFNLVNCVVMARQTSYFLVNIELEQHLVKTTVTLADQEAQDDVEENWKQWVEFPGDDTNTNHHPYHHHHHTISVRII